MKADLVRWRRGSAVRLKPVSNAKRPFRPTAALLRPRAGGEDGTLSLDTGGTDGETAATCRYFTAVKVLIPQCTNTLLHVLQQYTQERVL